MTAVAKQFRAHLNVEAETHVLNLFFSVISVYSVANCFAFDIEKCRSNILI